jgi:hypothetical protein
MTLDAELVKQRDVPAEGQEARRDISHPRTPCFKHGSGRPRCCSCRAWGRKFELEPLPVNLINAGQGRLPLRMRSFLDHASPRLRAILTALEIDR